MRIFDQDAQKKLDNIILYLTPEEAREIRGCLEIMLNNKHHHHSHISDENFQKEVTICIYREDNLSTFDERSRNLILKDE